MKIGARVRDNVNLVEAPPIEAENAIELTNVGIEFAINRKTKPHLRDMIFRGQRLRNVEKFWAVRNIDLKVKPGEAVGFVGPNGCGKSTLLKLIAGVYMPDEGTVKVNGDIAPLIELGAGFSGELSARDNIYLNGMVLGLTKEEIDERFENIVKFSGVRRFLDTPLKHFSSGMKVRVGFSVVAQLTHPIMLIDEVLAVGDRKFKRRSYKAMAAMLDAGRTLVLVSHNDKHIERFCDRAVYLKDGRIVMDGGTTEVLARYNADADAESDSEGDDVETEVPDDDDVPNA